MSRTTSRERKREQYQTTRAFVLLHLKRLEEKEEKKEEEVMKS